MNEFIEICEIVKQLELNYQYGSSRKLLVENGMTSLSGGSDDCIDFSGLTYGEFNGYEKRRTFTFEDDTKVSIKYENDGFWRIKILKVGSAEQHLIKATDEDKDYSDMFFIKSKKRGKQDE